MDEFRLDWPYYSDVDFTKLWDDVYHYARKSIQNERRSKMTEKEQMVDEMIKELLGLLKDGESLRISRIRKSGHFVSGVVNVVCVLDTDTEIAVDGGLNPAKLLASRI